MSLDASRPDRALLARLPFGDTWLALDPDALDPFDVRGRLAMYRWLVERANPRGAFGERDELSPFWGYAAQLAWQHRSGRLGTGLAIDRASWWGACNYALCAIPYAAAAQLAIVPHVALDTDGYAAALPAWKHALDAMITTRPGDDLEPVRFAILAGSSRQHIELAVRRHAREFRAMPEPERAFARGWIRMVDLFGAAALRTDLVQLAPHGAGALPSCMLCGDDDLPRSERGTVRRVVALGARPSWRWPLELAVWRRIMRTRAARDEVDRLLAAMFGRGGRAWRVRVRMLAYAARP